MSPLFLAILASFILATVLWYAALRHELVRANVNRLWGMALGAWCGLMVLGYLVVLLERWVTEQTPMPSFVTVLIFVWHILALPCLLVIVAAFGVINLVRWCRRACGVPPRSPSRTPSLVRRRLLTSLVVLPPALSTVGTAVALEQVQRFRVRELHLAIPRLPRELEGLRIAHVSDVHVGRFTHGAVLDEIVRAVNGFRPDLIAVTGDLINHRLSELPEAISMLRGMESEHGMFLCEGNHDLLDDGEAFRRQVRAAGLQLLCDEVATVEVRGAAVHVLGAAWWGDREVHVPANGLRLALVHHPRRWNRMRQAGVELTLAGHTHGGQLMWDAQRGFGPLLFEYWSGLYQQDDSALVVSNGVGNWFPLRINAPAELIHLTLHRA